MICPVCSKELKYSSSKINSFFKEKYYCETLYTGDYSLTMENGKPKLIIYYDGSNIIYDYCDNKELSILSIERTSIKPYFATFGMSFEKIKNKIKTFMVFS